MFRSTFGIGHWLIDVETNTITDTREGMVRRVQPKLMGVLACLAANQGRTVSREELIEEAWEGVRVTQGALTRTICQLRSVLEDDSRNPTLIETVSKNGYRLLVPVRDPEPPAVIAPPAPETEPVSTAVEKEYETKGTTEIQPEELPNRDERVRLWPFVGIAAAVVFFGLGSAWRMSLQTVAVQPEPLRILPLTTLEGSEFAPAFSPDGNRIAFLWDRAGEGMDLHIKQLGEEHVVRLTDRKGKERYATWSPDGNYLAFYREYDEGIFKVSSLGGAETRLLDLPGRVSGMDWSSDGNGLFYSWSEDKHQPTSIHALDTGTGQTRRLTFPTTDVLGDFYPAASPDGSKLAFVRSSIDGHSIFIADAQTGDLEIVAENRGRIFDLEWDGEGKNLLFSADRDARMAIWQAPLDGGPISYAGISLEQRDPLSFSLARGQQKLAYTTMKRELDVWIMELDQPQPQSRALISSTRIDGLAAWSPDQENIAFVSDRSGRPALWLGLADGSLPRMLAPLSSLTVTEPDFSPDGTMLVYADYDRLYTIPVNGGDPKLLADKGFNPVWAPDGNRIIYNAMHRENLVLKSIAPDGTNKQTLTEDNSDLLIGATHEGVWHLREEQAGLWFYSFASDRTRLVHERVKCTRLEDNHANYPALKLGWRLGRDAVYCVDFDKDGSIIKKIMLDTGEESVVARVGMNIYGIALSADEKRLLFGNYDFQSADIMLVPGFHL